MVRVKTIDAHAAGEPLRLIVDGFPAPRGKTMLEKREGGPKHAGHLRRAAERGAPRRAGTRRGGGWGVLRPADPRGRALMLEPRGHADMYGALFTEPVSPGSHA